jgi:hypothetical protein
MSREVRRFTPEEDACLVDLRRQGYTHQQIMLALGRARCSIQARLKILAAAGEDITIQPYTRREPPPEFSQIRTTRPCLCCNKLFPSEGPHNRLCGTCRTKSLSPYDL